MTDRETIRISLKTTNCRGYQTLGGRGVTIDYADGITEQHEPPKSWGEKWRWNFSEDGSGLEFYNYNVKAVL